MKHGKRLTALALALVMALGLMVQAGAAAPGKEVQAELNYDITVMYNGKFQTLRDAAGDTVYPISYAGTTYLPVRAVSSMLGVEVEWDSSTRTVLLSDPAEGRTAPKSGHVSIPAASGVKQIKAVMDPGVTVSCNGEAQSMKDAAGNAVYPLFYNGTTYLPVRAVSNMLDVQVRWDGETKTVMLRAPQAKKDAGSSGGTEDSGMTNVIGLVEEVEEDPLEGMMEGEGVEGRVIIRSDDLQGSREGIIKAGYSEAEADEMIEDFIWEMDDTLSGFISSSDADILGTDRIGCEWAEIDWTTAADGYVRVKVNEMPGPSIEVSCQTSWVKGSNDTGWKNYTLEEGEWDIPLYGESTEYSVSLFLNYLACDHYLTEAEMTAAEEWRQQLGTRFDAEVTNSDGTWTRSTVDIDYENAPLTRAKALELTENCTTDAEKITAVFNYVSKTIKYDQALYKKDVAATIEWKKAQAELDAAIEAGTQDEPVYCYMDPVNGQHLIPPEDTDEVKDLDLDKILTSKSGVCRHYAALMTGMLRSVGVPCKYVHGEMYTGEVLKGYNDDHPGWVGHAWVAVNPRTGTLNTSALGAGQDYSDPAIGQVSEPTGWIRLDPTNVHNKSLTSNDAKYSVEEHT